MGESFSRLVTDGPLLVAAAVAASHARSHCMISVHAPVTSSSPTRTRTAPPIRVTVRAFRRRNEVAPSAQRAPRATSTKGTPSPMQ